MQIYLSHSGNYDYETELYAPLKASNIAQVHHVFFPHDSANIDTKAKDVIADADVVVAEVSYSSTGQGIELGWANASNTPIVCMYKQGSNTSSSLRFVTNNFVEYDGPEDMLTTLGAWLAKQ